MTNYSFEQGPIRPPSEARSLLIRLTRNCPWNRCEFCHTYKGQRFEIRKVEEIKADIDTIEEVGDEIRSLSWRLGFGGDIDHRLIKYIFNNRGIYNGHFQSVAAWMYFGGKTAFIQDANSPLMRTSQIEEVVRYLKEKLPSIERITSYARSHTMARKRVEELIKLREAGLNRIHIGLETGYGPLLEYINKGVRPDEHIEAGRRVKEAGIELSEYVILGLGGGKWWQEHAVATALSLNRIDPDFIRVRTLFVVPGTPLYDKMRSGDFQRLGDEGVVKEERLLIQNLKGINSYFASDHVLNLLEEVDGKFPDEKGIMLDKIDEFLSLSPDDRLHFQVGRRTRFYRNISDMFNPELFSRVNQVMERLEINKPGEMEETIYSLMEGFI